MRDNVVDAARLGSLFAALNDGGLPGFAPVDVVVSRSAATSGGAGGPRSPAVAAGVAESGERFGGSVEGLCVGLGETDSEVKWDGARVAKDLGGGGSATSEPSGGWGVCSRKSAEGCVTVVVGSVEGPLTGW